MLQKKVLLSALIMMLIASACTSVSKTDSTAILGEPTAEASTGQISAEIDAPLLPDDNGERELLSIFIDGQAVNESGFAYADIKDAMTDKKINDKYYYSATIADVVDQDISSVKGAFLEAVDGYISYVDDIDNLHLAAYVAENGQYESIELDGKAVYAGVVSGAKDNKGVINVYLVTTPAAFEVEIQKNGEKIGVITIKEFMQKTEVGDKKVSTGLFDGSFLYNGGADTYQGKFLGISYETMLAKLGGLGMDLSGNIVEVEYYGTNGLSNVGKNTEYSTKEGDEKYFGSVDFYCMYDGKTYNSDTANMAIGLTAFINGTGGRWMTMDLTAINFIIE